ncbi:hypothetical protein OSB04_015822 [Centaurea solstitialis]|uniref:F-box domain-containing protein n=1 Tax=Centaurea solstitialis TaxID=347529 RepID=A0AA38W994_9ASTR|nr:hypothetical protein OSB04_015822 [Centaurea solstitialis]
MKALSAELRWISSQDFPILIDSSVEDLPTELTIDILSRLPVKTIINCKLVCKKWRNLVSDTVFVKLHLFRSPTCLIIHQHLDIRLPWNLIFPNNPGTLKLVEIEDKVDHHRLHTDPPMSLDLSLPPVLHNTIIWHIGSVNGLICLRQSSHKLNLFYDTYICNPVTREYMLLPRQCSHTPGEVYGFGVSSLKGEYKVIRTFQAKVVRNGGKPTQVEILPNSNKPSQPSVLEAEVYTLGTRQWRSLGPVRVTYQLDAFDQFYGLFLNNHCHWIVVDVENTYENICTFDFDKEIFQLFPSPPSESVPRKRCRGQSLAILKGCLCKLDTYDSELTIWVMKEYGIKNSWHKEVVIRPEICVDLKWPSYTPIHLIAGLKDGRFFMVFDRKVCVFDPRSQTIEDTKMCKGKLHGLPYRPSFLKLQNFGLESVHMF